MLDEEKITHGIVEEYIDSFLDSTNLEVSLVGAGPANLTAAKYLAEQDVKVAVFEKKLSIGGGMWGGGMMFSRIIVQDEGKEVLDEFGIDNHEYDDGYHVANSIESTCKLASKAIEAGAEIFNCVEVEDVLIRENDKVSGLVLNWQPVRQNELHVDPLGIKSEIVVDGTGHDAEVCRIVDEKVPNAKLSISGEKPMYAEEGERATVEMTQEVYPNLIAAGMAANNVSGGPRMGPIFGGMLLSGKKAAQIAVDKLR